MQGKTEKKTKKVLAPWHALPSSRTKKVNGGIHTHTLYIARHRVPPPCPRARPRADWQSANKTKKIKGLSLVRARPRALATRCPPVRGRDLGGPGCIANVDTLSKNCVIFWRTQSPPKSSQLFPRLLLLRIFRLRQTVAALRPARRLDASFNLSHSHHHNRSYKPHIPSHSSRRLICPAALAVWKLTWSMG